MNKLGKLRSLLGPNERIAGPSHPRTPVTTTASSPPPQQQATPAFEYIMSLKSRLYEACIATSPSSTQLRRKVPPPEIISLLDRARTIFASEPNVVNVPGGTTVHIFGDIHGQFFDLCHALDIAGWPRETTSPTFVFAGDYVDRGSWGVETLILLIALKLAFPSKVVLLRGNHESRRCANVYGFADECTKKVGDVEPFLDVFAQMPIAALINGDCLVVHAGPWRSPIRAGKVGTIDELQHRPKLGADVVEDPVVLDALWSDPQLDGFCNVNYHRGIGITYGPAFTKAFLETNKLKLVIRAHEGPDARGLRPGMADVHGGFCVDHAIAGVGSLVTLFSAPDYPCPEGKSRSRLGQTLGAFASLQPPAFNTVQFTQYAVTLPLLHRISSLL